MGFITGKLEYENSWKVAFHQNHNISTFLSLFTNLYLSSEFMNHETTCVFYSFELHYDHFDGVY